MQKQAKPCKLPYAPLGELFIGREDFLQKVRQSFDKARRESNTWPRQVIHGLGGVGKTRAAVEYGRKFEEHYNALLFINGESPDSLQRDLAGLAGVLNLQISPTTPVPDQVRAVLAWLQTHPGWLLIVDNVDDAKARDAVDGFLNQWTHGHVIITARWKGWGPHVETLDLHVLHPDDACRFLLESTRNGRVHTGSDYADARKLADDLGWLCLALQQASAYIIKQQMSFAKYQERWAKNKKNVRAWADKMLMKYREEKAVSLSVATTWQTTFDQLSPPARVLLHMLSYLASDPLPRGLFETDTFAEQLQRLSGDENADPEDALAELREFSLLQRSAPVGWESVGEVHRLVQLIAREQQSEEERQASLAGMLAGVNDYIPDGPGDVRTWPVWEPICGHVAAASRWADEAGTANPTTTLMNQLGLFLQTRCEFAQAEPLYRRALVIIENKFGPDHANAFAPLNNLTALLIDTDRMAEAELLGRRALAIGEKNFGPEHPDVATILVTLANLLGATKRLADAESLCRRALAINENSFGPDHPNVAMVLTNLVGILRFTKGLAKAEPLCRRALAINEKSFPPEHPDIATSRQNLAVLLVASDWRPARRVTKRLAEAERAVSTGIGKLREKLRT